MNTKSKKELKRLDAVVISDTHLGTRSCKAKELLAYLKSVQPNHLILNGDIIDIWQFSKSYFPKAQLKVVRQIIKMMEQGTKVQYVVGNHDEALRRFVGTTVGNFSIVNKVVLDINGAKSWIFHGDAFDVVMQHSKWLAKLGATGYALLTIINKIVNVFLSLFGKMRISLSRDIKRMVKSKRDDITTKFEKTVAELAIKKRYKYAICGHIHWPAKKFIENDHGKVMYLNSGDWVENLTALEFENNDWDLVYFNEEDSFLTDEDLVDDADQMLVSDKLLFQTMFQDVLSD
ncbi:UDP-2,3-diacylglucosamine diphosphatase [Plebeiibacterium sediminum]|uniref:UDP-2,3-diacylglucosamine diphosphatase n=1 Tax=Plebeiibacterium sediminum TaxID=2992112 RepID=A0AAE3SGG2_9BACT|nr:UDP-2,3-diacylglucosamine diphosphatase [Plebeiobacterium sediminum]MCW3788057.1 UDP-2,3-diacylglucosamine diphosphatase [Plebeiobacterium sediminum]